MLAVAGHALLIECADEAVAVRFAQDSKTKHLCRLLNNRIIVVPAESESAFKRAARKLGYPVMATARDRR